MKTNKENINQELKELKADFLMSIKKEAIQVPLTFQDDILKKISEETNKVKTINIKKMAFTLSGIAASLIIGIFIFSNYNNNTTIQESTFSNVSDEEILLYIEDNISNYTEDQFYALVELEETENLFDNAGISDEYLEEYFINQLNEEIQMEDLL